MSEAPGSIPGGCRFSKNIPKPFLMYMYMYMNKYMYSTVHAHTCTCTCNNMYTCTCTMYMYGTFMYMHMYMYNITHIQLYTVREEGILFSSHCPVLWERGPYTTLHNIGTISPQLQSNVVAVEIVPSKHKRVLWCQHSMNPPWGGGGGRARSETSVYLLCSLA